MSLLFRALISALLVGMVAFGNTLQAALSNGQEPTKWQLYSAVLGGLILGLNDLKSRFTPSISELDHAEAVGALHAITPSVEVRGAVGMPLPSHEGRRPTRTSSPSPAEPGTVSGVPLMQQPS